ncbi:2OG-Fe dioxygenase family protein [Streptomyces hundungensis]|uniref:2OG-Fe dioxygenase family protein n=1 Tax=Streptomyces hundungensis TaxID=1077946 RepID=UPI0033D84DAD
MDERLDGASSALQGGSRSAGFTRTAKDSADPVLEGAWRAVVSQGSYLMTPDRLSRCLGVAGEAWGRFAAHWGDLVPDAYAAQQGTRRLRRYGHFCLTRRGGITSMPHVAFVQPEDSNPLYVATDRHFEPLTEAFMAEPMLTSLIRMLGRVAARLEDADEWSVKVHPFRVVARAGQQGEPAPEGCHRDGVTLVTSLLINRENALGGTSTVYDTEGEELMSTTLSEPGSLLLSDDRSTLHGVSSIRPAVTDAPAVRDVLVTTLTAR